MTIFLTIAVVVLIFIVIFQIAKASEYVSILKGDDISRKQNNKINGFLMVVFLILGLIGVWYCNKLYFGKTLLAVDAASVEGARVDSMLWITLAVTGIVFIGTQIILFWFAYKYQEKDNRKVFYFAHSNKLEAIWTVIPALVLTVLVIIGLRNWFLFTGEPPKDAMVVEITGKQFGWIYRYPGKDGAFGKKYYKNIDPATNTLGILWEDELAHDDLINEQSMVLVKGRPVKLIIGSRDVIHDVGLPHFRLKMDAVPGIPTTMWFTPKYTTKEMKEMTNNPNFIYEISCDQMCGNGHYSMKGIIDVVDQEEYDVWIAKQKPQYLVTFPDKDPSNAQSADTTKLAVKPVETATKTIAKL
ncbi:MAG: cytochrome c oxidase subunit II [Chitinophagaceae bacterium]|nr:cytochrome c oxidase subunit II [Chitinophagaceae bacterium]MDP1765209.1 cytochrome c oxidase subunit II [Sediminibacterium sp.]MDP1810526.1 cytochrome c oxidase subunit II [Sediminibacterium sp.]MDP3129597.1 cytochrome c oxidase subunit II [Sediminibacterium sp.]MDP3666315.1 cytochrome c oxidase subunit II [Sediminibacterium sp.]